MDNQRIPMVLVVIALLLLSADSTGSLWGIFFGLCAGPGGPGPGPGPGGPCGNSGPGDCAEDGGSSTPFLYVWDGEQYIMDNDVMFGKPRSYFPDLQAGINRYKKGEVGTDVYKLTQTPQVDGKEIKLQLREIEPEQSAIDFAALKACVHAADTTLVTRSDFSGSIQTSKATVAKNLADPKKVVVYRKDNQKSEVYEYVNSEKDILLEEGDVIEYTFDHKTEDDLYILLDSWYRDWTLGEMFWSTGTHTRSSIKSPIQFSRSLPSVVKTITAGVVATLVGLFGYGNSMSKESGSDPEKGNTSSTLLESFGIEKAFADNPHKSLIVSVWNGTQYDQIEVVQPRYRRPTLSAVKVPRNLVCIDGPTKVQIYATKRHRVSGIGYVIGEDVTSADSKEYDLELKSAESMQSNVNAFGALRTPRDNSFLYTQPGDIFTLTYALPDQVCDAHEQPELEVTYLFEIGGVYAYLPKEEQESLGDWTKNLDKEAIDFLQTTYESNANRAV